MLTREDNLLHKNAQHRSKRMHWPILFWVVIAIPLSNAYNNNQGRMILTVTLYRSGCRYMSWKFVKNKPCQKYIQRYFYVYDKFTYIEYIDEAVIFAFNTLKFNKNATAKKICTMISKMEHTTFSRIKTKFILWTIVFLIHQSQKYIILPIRGVSSNSQSENTYSYFTS